MIINRHGTNCNMLYVCTTAIVCDCGWLWVILMTSFKLPVQLLQSFVVISVLKAPTVCVWYETPTILLWWHNGLDGVSNYRRLDSLPNRLFKRRSKKISKLCATGLCAENSPVTGEFPAQRASNAANVSIWWCHHDIIAVYLLVVAVYLC